MGISGNRRAAAGAVLALALGLTAPAALAAGPSAEAAGVRPAPARQKLSVVLPLKADEAGLERFATEVNTPGSSDYGQYESVASLSRRFGASPAVRTRTLRYLRSVGASGARIDATGLFADATMPVSLAQRAFGTSLSSFHLAHAPRFVAPGGAAHVPGPLAGAVTGVVGLDTQPVFSQPLEIRTAGPRARVASSLKSDAADGASGYLTRTGTASGCTGATSGPGFTPNQYQTAYGYAPLQAAGVQGQGERVALIEIDGFRYSDLRAFSNCFGLATPAVNSYGVGVSKALAPAGESTLDLEVLDAAAPRLKAIDVYETHPEAVDVLRALTSPLQNPGRKPDVISASLGACESQTLVALGVAGLRSIEGSLAVAAASGISVLASSGDAGSSSCLTRAGEPIPQLAVSFPASSPFVTAVGGTNFALSPSNGIVAQTVWNDAPAEPVAGGGGVSGLFQRPSYQKGFVTPNRRAVPDVAMLADPFPGYEIYCSVKNACTDAGHPDPWSTVGGTSAAAPLLAGGLALVDQELRIRGRQDVGLVNPLLYKLDHFPGAAGVISDVVTGNDDLGSSLRGRPLGCCSAHVGFDYASGLGGVSVSALSAAADSLVARIVSVGLSVPRQRPLASEHILARVSCSGQCLLGAYARITVGRAKSGPALYSGVAVLRHRGAKLVNIGLSRALRSRLGGQLAHHDRITATVYGAIVDPGGTIERQTRPQNLSITG
jgi:subtilase family serine protease